MVLFSGGQDSTTCLYWAKARFDEVLALGFDYGQRHAIELDQARKIAAIAGVTFTVLDARGLVVDSALTRSDQDLDAPHPGDGAFPATFVPGRNLLFLSIAASFAYARDIADLVTGVCQTDYSGYPDCRRVFIESLETTLSLALARDYRIHTPLMYLDKADTFKLAEDLGILELVLEETHTDYHGDRSTRQEWGYGKPDNAASRLRAAGWQEFKRRYRK